MRVIIRNIQKFNIVIHRNGKWIDFNTTTGLVLTNNTTLNFRVLDSNGDEIYTKTLAVDKINTSIIKRILYQKTYDSERNILYLTPGIQNGCSTDYIEYNSGSGWNFCSSTITITQNGIYNFRAIDEFGNEIAIATITIDDIANYIVQDDGSLINSDYNDFLGGINQGSSIKDIINSITETFQAFSFIFSMLPSFIWALIGLSLVAMIVLRVLGR